MKWEQYKKLKPDDRAEWDFRFKDDKINFDFGYLWVIFWFGAILLALTAFIMYQSNTSPEMLQQGKVLLSKSIVLIQIAIVFVILEYTAVLVCLIINVTEKREWMRQKGLTK